ncbi:MAG: glycosyltransferase family 2 protein [Patescibacteria group bacterium]
MKSAKTKKRPQPVLSILIPVYNEENTLNKILTKTTDLKISNYEVIIVNDASYDKTASIIKKFANSFKSTNVNLSVFTHKINKGKGAAIKTALKQAKGEYFVIQDADLEYDPKDIQPLLNRAITDDLPAVYGSRFLGTIKNMPRANYFANKFYNFMLRRLYDTDITDMHTCYKLVRTDLMKEFKMQSEGFGYATELVSRLLKRNVNITDMPINFNGRTKKQGKKIGVKDGVDCIYMMFKYRFSKSA